MPALDFLVAAQNPDGGWGYKRGGMSYVEPTAAVLLALQRSPGLDSAASSVQAESTATPAAPRATLSPSPAADHAYARGLEFLRVLQHADGGWGIARVDAESGWMTAWAVWALTAADRTAAARGADWLLGVEGLRTTNPTEVEEIRRLLKIDASLRGWPWQTGDAAWIFPTALALLALHAMGHDAHPRVQEGIKFLLDRAIPSGGWNVGNPSMLNAELPATIVNTALVLVALGDFSISDETVSRGREWLGRHLGTAETTPELAWGLWAPTHLPADATSVARLKALARPDGSWDGNPLTSAIALLALG